MGKYSVKENSKNKINQLFTSGNDSYTNKHTGLLEDKLPPMGLSERNTSLNLNMLEVIAIQKEALYKRERSRHQMTETLYDVGCRLSRTLDQKKLLHLILTYLAEFMPHDRAAVMLKQGDTLRVIASRGFPKTVPHAQLTVSLKEDNVFQQVCQTKRAVLVPDTWSHPLPHQVVDLPPGRTWVGVPLIFATEVVGILSISRTACKTFIDDQVSFVIKFAKQTAIALKNSQTYETMVDSSQELEGTLLERTQALQMAYVELEYLDETKSDFVSIASHELRTPLTALQGYSQILLQNEVIEESAHLSEMMKAIYTSTQRLHQIIDTMLDVAKIDNQTLELHKEPVSLASLVKRAAGNFEQPLVERNHQLNLVDLEELPDVAADSNALHKVLGGLLSNAIKYTPDGGSITVSGVYNQQKQCVEIVVSDTGIGIDPQFRELIFTKFCRTDDVAYHSTGATKFKGAGPGLGLTVARGIIEMHEGRIWVESAGHDEKRCPGSQFHIVLPIAAK